MKEIWGQIYVVVHRPFWQQYTYPITFNLYVDPKKKKHINLNLCINTPLVSSKKYRNICWTPSIFIDSHTSTLKNQLLCIECTKIFCFQKLYVESPKWWNFYWTCISPLYILLSLHQLSHWMHVCLWNMHPLLLIQTRTPQIAASSSPHFSWTLLILSTDLQIPLQLQSNDATQTLPAWAFHSQSAEADPIYANKIKEKKERETCMTQPLKYPT